MSDKATTTPKPAGMTKVEAVRRAMARLGNDAKPLALQSFIKHEFKIDMTADHISTTKADILKRQGGQAQAGKPAAAPAPAAPQAAAAEPTAEPTAPKVAANPPAAPKSAAPKAAVAKAPASKPAATKKPAASK